MCISKDNQDIGNVASFVLLFIMYDPFTLLFISGEREQTEEKTIAIHCLQAILSWSIIGKSLPLLLT